MKFLKSLIYLVFIALVPVRSWRTWQARLGFVLLLCAPMLTTQAQPKKPLFDANAYQQAQAKRDLQPPASGGRGAVGSKWFKPLFATALGCGVFDSLTTERQLRRGFAEGNPLLRGSLWRRQGISWGARAGLLALFWRLRRGNPKAVNVGLGALAAWGCGAGAWNSAR